MKFPRPDLWNRLSPLLDEMLELERDAQQRRLQALQASDPELGAELAALLGAAQDARASGFLGGEAGEVGHEPPEPATLVGRQIGAYLIDAHLGQGGTGTVWRATRADGRYQGAAAIKLLHLSLLGRAGAVRFEREGAILARLNHPNIARLLDAGVTDEGQPYLVLELVDGVPIDRYCDTQRLDVVQRLKLFGGVLAGVAHAHSHLVIHRDIKPSNILVTAGGSVKLLDFGVAKLLEGDPDATPVTVENQRALTPRHAAPEQFTGESITTATDIYALGVLLYQLLVARHPTHTGAATSNQSMRATLETEPLRLSTALLTTSPDDPTHDPERIASERSTSLPRLARQLQGDLENIIAMTLRKDPAQRYQTAGAFAEDIRRHLESEPVRARPSSLSYRCARFVRRNRGSLAAVALIVASVLAGLAGTITQSQRAQTQMRRANLERDHALRQLSYAKSTTEFITFLLEEGSDRPLTTTELLARAAPALDKQYVGDPGQRANLLLKLAVIHGQAADVKKAQDLLVRARDAAEGVDDPALHAAIECESGFLSGVAGAFDDATRHYEAGLAATLTDPDIDRALRAECLQGRAEIGIIRGDKPGALRDARDALALLGTPGAEDLITATDMLQTLAFAEAMAGDMAAGARDYRRAIAQLEGMGRGHSRPATFMYIALGVLLSRAGQTLESLAAANHALELSQGVGGAIPALEGNIGYLLTDLGRGSEAIPLYEHAIAGARARGDRRSAETIAATGARAWCETGDLVRCDAMITHAQAEMPSLLPPNHVIFGTLDQLRAERHLALGEPALARADLLRATALYQASNEAGRPLILALALLARVDLRLGDLDAARAHASLAVESARAQRIGFDHTQWMGVAQVALGLVQRAAGDAEGAHASWLEAEAELRATLGASAPRTREAAGLASRH